ncbi:MAG TPA: sulfite oxidase [Vicinamibacteria bacterium]|nr:sulfite oxidase [Vicinamibacteria bacterium]
MTEPRTLSRRQALAQGSGMLAALAFLDSHVFAAALEGERTLPFLDQPSAPPAVLGDVSLLDWQQLDAWVTPADKFFRIAHFGVPDVDAAAYKLEVAGLVASPRNYSLAELRAFPKKEVAFTLECSGNSGFDWFQGGIGNARWAGAPLAAVLEKAGLKKEAIEVVFYGADAGEQTLPYISGLGERVGEFKAKQAFARSLSVAEAMDPANLLCYEMNGSPLSKASGSPLRLIAPRFYGIANVKWLTRIELLDRRFQGTFMAETYVTVRETRGPDGQPAFVRTAIGRTRLKSIAAKVTVKDGRHRIYGAAWGAPVARVEVRVDDGPWQPATIDEGREHEFAWKFWHLDWGSPAAGEHRIVARAIDTLGNAQPAPDDPAVKAKRTYWESDAQIPRRIRI